MFENHYLYKVTQTLFNKGKEEMVNVSCTVIIRCEASKISVKAIIYASMHGVSREHGVSGKRDVR